jgi:hypothetical protein
MPGRTRCQTSACPQVSLCLTAPVVCWGHITICLHAFASLVGKWGSLFATSDYALWEPTLSLFRDRYDLVLPSHSAVISLD